MGIRKFTKVDRELTGQKNNLLTAVSRVVKNGRWYWNCSCECGGDTCIREDYFISGKTKSCGCYGSRNSAYKINQKKAGHSALNSHFKSYVISAKKRGYVFSLTKEEFEYISKQDCHYCRAAPRDSCYNATAHGNLKINGIDRKDSKIGYKIENCLPCCSVCNMMKGSLDYNEFISRCGTIYLIKKLEKL